MTNMLFGAEQNYGYQVMTIWVVVTDGERIRILEIVDANETPQEVNITNLGEVDREDSLAPPNEFSVPGNQEVVQSETTLGNADPVVADFIHAIRSHLEQARRQGLFDHLIVVAPSEILGVLKDNLTTEVREILMLELETDLIDADAAVIRASLPL